MFFSNFEFYPQQWKMVNENEVKREKWEKRKFNFLLKYFHHKITQKVKK